MRTTTMTTGLVLVLALLATPVLGGMTYTNETAFRGALDQVGTINWDDVPTGPDGIVEIAADRYEDTAWGSPIFSLASDAPNAGMYVSTPQPDGPFHADFYPVSGQNVFSPGDHTYSPEGALTVTFDQRMYGIGAWFLDVETDFAGTGIRIGTEEYTFTENQGEDSQSFLGVIIPGGFTEATILMADDESAMNGVGIDDLIYGTVPVPGAAVLGMLGLGLIARIKRRVA